MLSIDDSIYDNRKSSIACIVQLVKPWIIVRYSTEHIKEKTKPPLREDKQDILIEIIEHKFTILTVALSPEIIQ